MITADEARAIKIEHDQHRINEIEEQIKIAARCGKRSIETTIELSAIDMDFIEGQGFKCFFYCASTNGAFFKISW